MKRYRTITLGCKVNQCESAAIGHLLEQTGYSKADRQESADIVVINTCTVTSKAGMQSRQAIRKAVRAHPCARIVVTGCHAQTDAEQIQAIEGVDLVLANADKMRIAEIMPSSATALPIAYKAATLNSCDFTSLASVAREERTRAFLKIQDGCNTRCTYCIVPDARGRSRSMPMAEAVAHMHSLAGERFREVVLTGIHLGVYGADLEPATSLIELLRKVTSPPIVERIRLSSIEATEVSEDLLQLFSEHRESLCPHFHIPLQSGDNTILRRMARPYTREHYSQIINRIRHLFPHAAIGADVMAGFPGESDAAFAQTRDLIAALPITYLHVFPFSPRKGTPAAGFKHKVPESIAKERCRELRQLGKAKHDAFLQAMIGCTLKVLIETSKDKASGYSKGLSGNYLPVAVNDQRCTENTFIDVHIAHVTPEGTLVGSASPPRFCG
jgi:threonylcarbamoyladenosine tRNA methylthiotransferase MtaB